MWDRDGLYKVPPKNAHWNAIKLSVLHGDFLSWCPEWVHLWQAAGLNGITVKYQQHYLSDQEKENRWDHQNGLQNDFLSLWMWVIPNVPWSN